MVVVFILILQLKYLIEWIIVKSEGYFISAGNSNNNNRA
jgi:hypothetical protein